MESPTDALRWGKVSWTTCHHAIQVIIWQNIQPCPSLLQTGIHIQLLLCLPSRQGPNPNHPFVALGTSSY